MAKKLREEEKVILQQLGEKHSDVFFLMLGKFVYEGMDVSTAIWECHNQLECGGANG